MTAKGLSPRCLAARNLATATSSDASAAKWKPPTPFTATMRPAASASAAAAITSGTSRVVPPASHQRSDGPQSGQQIGSAWNLRSVTSVYSRAHSGHMAKAAIVVRERS